MTTKGQGAYQRWKSKANCRCSDCGKLITPKGKSGMCHKCIYKGDRSYNWKGKNIKVASGRARARKLYTPTECEICGDKAEIHHIDHDTMNNKADNITFLCRYHHQLVDGRIEQLKRQAKQAGLNRAKTTNRDNKGRFT